MSDYEEYPVRLAFSAPYSQETGTVSERGPAALLAASPRNNINRPLDSTKPQSTYYSLSVMQKLQMYLSFFFSLSLHDSTLQTKSFYLFSLCYCYSATI